MPQYFAQVSCKAMPATIRSRTEPWNEKPRLNSRGDLPLESSLSNDDKFSMLKMIQNLWAEKTLSV